MWHWYFAPIIVIIVFLALAINSFRGDLAAMLGGFIFLVVGLVIAGLLVLGHFI